MCYMATKTKGRFPTSMRLSPRGVGLLARLSAKLGLSRSGVMEMSVRRLAELEGISTEDEMPAAPPPTKRRPAK